MRTASVRRGYRPVGICSIHRNGNRQTRPEARSRMDAPLGMALALPVLEWGHHVRKSASAGQRMVIEDQLLEPFIQDMGVDFGCRDI